MSYDDYKCLKVKVERGVAFITIDHPPMNLLDGDLILEIDRIGQEAAAENSVKVLVFESADQEIQNGYIEEEYLCNQLMVSPEARRRMNQFMESGGQNRENETNFQTLIQSLRDDWKK